MESAWAYLSLTSLPHRPRDVHAAVVVAAAAATVVVAVVMAMATVVEGVAMEAVAMVMEAVDKHFIFRSIFN